MADSDMASGSTLDAMDVAVAITSRSIRDPAQGVYEYLEERHEEQGLRQGCYLFPMRLSGWILRREGLLTKSYKRRFCVFDPLRDELALYRNDDTSRETGKLLRRLVATRVDMTIENGLGELRFTGYEREKELYKADSDRIASRHVASGGSSAVRLPGEQQKFYRPQYEQLRAVSVKATTVWGHCLRHHVKNYRRRKRMMRLAELEALERWDLIEELLDEDDEDDDAGGDEDFGVEPEFVFKEVRKDPLDARRGKRVEVPQLVFDGEGDLRITQTCDFSSLAGVRAGEALKSKKDSFPPAADAVGILHGPRRDRDQSKMSSLPEIKESTALWRAPSANDLLLLSDHMSVGAELTHSSSSIWEDEAILAYRVAFDSVKRTRLLSSGSYGEVWLAQYRGTQTVAVKCLKQTIDRKRQQIRDFAREIRLLSKLDHKRIITFLGVAWTMESDVQMLMEFMPYGDLRTFFSHLSSQKPKPRRIPAGEDPELVWTAQQWRIAVDVIEGLVYLHSLNAPLIHCDLKSRNLLLDVNVRVKIADFGIARVAVDTDSEGDGSESVDNVESSSSGGSSGMPPPLHATTQRAMRGTGRWIAPEMLAGSGEFTPAVDVYSFGVVLTEIDTFELPFHAQTLNRDGEEIDETVLLHHIMADGWTPKFSKTCPEEVRTIAQQCMAFDPADRPSSLDVAHRLRKAMAKAVGK